MTTRPFDKLRVTKEKGSRIRGVKGSSDNNETLRYAQGDRREGFKSTKFKVQSSKVRGSSYKLEPTEKFYFLSIKEFLDAVHRGCRIIPSPLVGEG